MNIEQFETLLNKWMPDWDEVEKKYHHKIKQPTLDALRDYLFLGYPTGDFLQAVFSNDLFESIGRADPENCESLRWIVRLIYNEFPMVAKDYALWMSLHMERARKFSNTSQ